MEIKLYFKRVQFAQDGNINFDVMWLPIRTYFTLLYFSHVYTVSTSILTIIFLANILILIEGKMETMKTGELNLLLWIL